VENLPVPFDRRVWAEANTLRDAGYTVSVICPKGHHEEPGREVIDGISVYRHPAPPEGTGAVNYLVEYAWALFWEFLLSFRVAAREGLDAVHACNPPDLIFLVGAFWKLFFGKKFLFDHHDINPEFYEAKFGRRDFFWKLLRAAERASFALADVSIATNESYRAIALQRGRMRPERVFVVRSGPNLSRIRRRPPDPLLKKGRRYLVAYVGVIGEPEGIDLLLRAALHIARDRGRDDVRFVIMGSGPRLAAMQEFSHSLDLDEVVEFTGRVDDDTLFTTLATADVCVNPDYVNSYNDKSTMNKVMEYMAMGKPIVQFDTVEGRRSAESSALYAVPNDPLDFAQRVLQLLDDPDLRGRMGDTGRRRVEEELAWTHEAPKLLSAYEALFSKSAQVRSEARHP
jgi:glycosyltransferase involved in cell wall biosynthesis